LPVWVSISDGACVDACGNLHLNQYFHSRQIKLYSLNSTERSDEKAVGLGVWLGAERYAEEIQQIEYRKMCASRQIYT